MRKSIVLVSIALVAILALSGCGSDSNESESKSKESTTESIVVYTGRNLDLVEPLVEQFEKDTGIKVELRDGDSAELATQIITEGKASKADVFFSQDAGALGLLETEEILSEIPSGITAEVPDRFKSKNGNWVGTSGRARVLVYNESQKEDLPANLEEMVSPEYKGKIAFAPTNASFQSFVTALRVSLGETAAQDWLEAFAANEPKVYEKNSAIVKAVNDGEIPMGLVNHYYLYELTSEIGQENINAKNLYFEDGSAGSLVNVAGVAILENSKNKDAAQKFVEYLLSEKGQKFFVEQTFEYPVTSAVEPAENLPELSKLGDPNFDLSDLETLDKTIELLDKVGLLTK
ncbi:MAG TPA: iron ABC transporter substrate-binding protein [Acidimicrobiia bacterium]|nr:iron ABC transporter substrate-binding protein [Acidimicrobiia bacterium]